MCPSFCIYGVLSKAVFISTFFCTTLLVLCCFRILGVDLIITSTISSVCLCVMLFLIMAISIVSLLLVFVVCSAFLCMSGV